MPVKKKEGAVDKLLARLREVPAFYYTEKVLGILIAGYIETSEESKFDFGPMNTTISANEVEGARFRVGGVTTAQLNPHWFARGYVAYGTKDEKMKYSGEVEYSFNKKKFHSREFPIHSIKLNHTYDIDQLGQQYMYTNKDNVFLSSASRTTRLPICARPSSRTCRSARAVFRSGWVSATRFSRWQPTASPLSTVSVTRQKITCRPISM